MGVVQKPASGTDGNNVEFCPAALIQFVILSVVAFSEFSGLHSSTMTGGGGYETQVRIYRDDFDDEEKCKDRQ